MTIVAQDGDHALTFADRYNPFVSPQLEDPYPTYAAARREAPIFFSPVLSLWVVSRYEDIIPIYRNPAVFSSSCVITARYEATPEAARVLEAGGYVRSPLTVDNDPPDHTRVRQAVNKAFAPARVARLEAHIRATARELVGAFERDGRADLVARFFFVLPLYVMLDLLGLPRADMQRVRAWGEAWAAFMWAPLAPEQQLECARSMVEYLDYCRAHVAARKAAPGDDLLSDLVRGQSDGTPALSDLEIAMMINDLLFAGHETTKNTLANMVKLLLEHPDQWADLLANPELVPGAIEEAMRMDSPVQVALRVTTTEVEVAGTTLPRGAGVCLVIGSANHDEAAVPDPERFDIRRKKPERHLTFGHGIHFCLGAMLARLEARVAVGVLTERLRGLRFASEEPISYRPNLLLRGPERLILAWDPPADAADRSEMA